MFCKKCKKEIANDSKFCEFCGAKVENANRISRLTIREALFNKKAFHFWLFFIAVVLLVITTLNGDSYDWKKDDAYILLKFYIFCISLYFSFLKFKIGGINVAFPFMVVGIIFNPFFTPNFSDDETISFLAFFSAIFFGYFSYKEYKRLRGRIGTGATVPKV